jgi:hypothetical protein
MARESLLPTWNVMLCRHKWISHGSGYVEFHPGGTGEEEGQEKQAAL